VEGQETLDRLFGVTPEERARLREGKLPGRLLDRLRQTAGLPRGNWVAVLLVTSLLVGVWLGLRTGSTRSDRAFVLLLIPPLSALVIALRRWRRGQAAVPTVAPVQVLEGQVETVRSWWFGYGEIYYLWAAFKLADHAEPIEVFTILGSVTVTGWARIYVVRVKELARAVAVEVDEATSVVERQPGRPPPEEPLLINVPAD
jgi:hypothetical protein